MKKSLILALALAAPVFAGDPVVAPPPTVYAPAPTCGPWALEAAAVYGFAMEDVYDGLVSKDIDVYGADLTLVYALNDNHSVNLRFGYTFGDECVQGTDLDGGFTRWETDIHTFTLMPGYRYTHALNEKWSLYGGANLGVANVSVKDSWSATWQDGNGLRNKAHDSDWGLAWSLEVGAQYNITPCWYLFATYGLAGSTAETKPLYTWEGGWKEGDETDQLWYQVIRLGVGAKF